MNFVLFLLLNVVLFMRPEEFIPDIAGLRLYVLVVIPCTVLTLPRLQELLSPESLRNRPVAVCVLLFFVSTILSLCVLGRITEAFFDFGPEFAKIILYYFLLLAIVDTPGRFRVYIVTLIAMIAILSIIALAQHYGFVNFPNIKACNEFAEDVQPGERTIAVPRLVSSGIFNDPNDLCLVLGLGIMSCIYGATTTKLEFVGRLPWMIPLPIFGFALMQTHSRGGLLGVLAGGAGYIFSRFGGPKSIPYAAAGAVAILVLIGGRQGNISGGGTAHERLMMWAEGLRSLFTQPLYLPTGLGNGWFVSEFGLVAHNSFVQAYIEHGIIGGGAFFGAFFLAAYICYRLGRGVDAPSWALEARHYAFAAVVGYAVGCYSITRNYVIPTYLALGIASVLFETAAPTMPEKFQVNGKWFGRAILLSICGIVLIKLATQSLGMFGV